MGTRGGLFPVPVMPVAGTCGHGSGRQASEQRPEVQNLRKEMRITCHRKSRMKARGSWRCGSKESDGRSSEHFRAHSMNWRRKCLLDDPPVTWSHCCACRLRIEECIRSQVGGSKKFVPSQLQAPASLVHRILVSVHFDPLIILINVAISLFDFGQMERKIKVRNPTRFIPLIAISCLRTN
jgi:hypothetical protein